MGDCSSYLAPGGVTSITDDNAQANLAGYGACQGANAIESGIFNSGIVQNIESAIAQGGAEAAQITGLATLGLSIVGDAAVAVSVMPIVGVALTIVFAVANELNSLLGSGPQLYVPNPHASGSDSIADPKYGVFEKINASDYGSFINNAMSWINANPALALSMDPESFSNQHNVFVDIGQLQQLSSSVVGKLLTVLNGGTNVYSNMSSSTNPPPGAYEMLRAIQMPAASAIVVAVPNQAAYLTGCGVLGNPAVSTGYPPLMLQFPALTNADMTAIFNASSSPYNDNIEKATTWLNGQCPPPSISALTAPTVGGFKSLSAIDACTLLSQWSPSPNPCPGYVAPPCTIQITGTQNISLPFGGSIILPIVNPISGSDLPGTPIALSRSASTTTKVVLGAAAVGTGVVLWHVFVGGYTLASTSKGVVSDAKAAYKKTKSWVERELGGRKKNPIQLFGLHAATRGRSVAYRADLGNGMDRIALTKTGSAVLYRREQPVAKFKASKYQKTKIRSGEGEVLIFTDQLER